MDHCIGFHEQRKHCGRFRCSKNVEKHWVRGSGIKDSCLRLVLRFCSTRQVSSKSTRFPVQLSHYQSLSGARELLAAVVDLTIRITNRHFTTRDCFLYLRTGLCQPVICAEGVSSRVCARAQIRCTDLVTLGPQTSMLLKWVLLR